MTSGQRGSVHAKARGQVQRRLKGGRELEKQGPRELSVPAKTPTLPGTGICASWSHMTSAKGMLWCKRGGTGGKGGSRESPTGGHLGQVTIVLTSRFQAPAGTRKRGCCIANGLGNLFVDSTLKQFRENRQPSPCMAALLDEVTGGAKALGPPSGLPGHWSVQ